MELKYRLLDHPFYKSWSDGSVTQEQLSKYSASYMEFIERIPVYWKKVVDAFVPESTEGKTVIVEEQSHIPMWERWSSNLESVKDYPKMDELFKKLHSMNPSELLGAIHAFEIQQPEVALTKKEGLLRFYGFDDKDLIYFDEHIDESEHINFGKELAEKFADRNDFIAGFETGSVMIYKSLDMFVNC